jgi:Ca2+-binding RTX toxin-like protein
MTVTVSYDTITTKAKFRASGPTFDTPDAHDILGLSGGGFVAAFAMDDPAEGRLFLNFYDAAHDVIGGAVVANENTATQTNTVGQPRLTELANGNVLVVWDENNDFESDAGLKGHIYTSAGLAVGGEFDLTDNSTAYSEPNVTALSNGNFVVTYHPASGAGVSARIFDSSGSLVSGPITVDGSANQHDSQVTALAGGGYVVAWTDETVSDGQVQARVYDNNGAPQTGVTTIAVGGDNVQPAIAALPNGNFALVYADDGWAGAEAGSRGITLQIFDRDLNNLTPGTWIHVNSPDAKQEADPSVTVLSNGFILVSWTYPFSLVDHDIFARIYDQAGNPITQNNDPDQFIITSSTAIEKFSAISALKGGEFITAWQDSTSDGDGGQIASVIKELTRTVVGDATGETFTGDILRDSIDGGDGDDSLYGGGGLDTIIGSGGYDLIYGGAGGDLLQGGSFADVVHGGSGNDLIYSAEQATPQSSMYGDNLYGEDGEDRLRGSQGNDTIEGGDQDDNLSGASGNDLLRGGDDSDVLKGGQGDDTLGGGLQSDTLVGALGNDVLYAVGGSGESGDGDVMAAGSGDDTVYGSLGADSIVGSYGKDLMYGDAGADTISGGGGRDVLTGGGGADRLTGGSQADWFHYLSQGESTVGQEDLITDLANQDVIDLGAIDAKSLSPGNQHFTRVSAFSGHQGELVVEFHASGAYAGLTTISGDVNGDAVADFVITATGDHHAFTHFVL